MNLVAQVCKPAVSPTCSRQTIRIQDDCWFRAAIARDSVPGNSNLASKHLSCAARTRANSERWHNDDYLILFEGHEVEQKEQAYGIDRLLPGYTLLGLIGWDDFLVMERATRKLFRIPTIPIASEQRKEWRHSLGSIRLQPDEQFRGQIKWYVKPIVFGGDPNPGENITWISHDEHVQAVKYWNDLYSHARKQ